MGLEFIIICPQMRSILYETADYCSQFARNLPLKLYHNYLQRTLHKIKLNNKNVFFPLWIGVNFEDVAQK
eukprot:jgi/Bigna1/64027/fgenesh1_kg.65_\